MFSFKNWIITIVGASLLVSLFEMILPSGKMNFFLKSVLNLFYMYLVILPIIELVKGFI